MIGEISLAQKDTEVCRGPLRQTPRPQSISSEAMQAIVVSYRGRGELVDALCNLLTVLPLDNPEIPSSKAVQRLLAR